MRIELPSGAWVKLGAASEITERRRRPIRVAMARFSPTARKAMVEAGNDGKIDEEAFTPEDQQLSYEINDLVTAAIIVEASFLQLGEECTVDHITSLRGADYDALQEQVSPAMGAIMSGVDFDPSPDPTSPTVPSSE